MSSHHFRPLEAGQESVWDYPRPPRLERTERRIRIAVEGRKVADTTSAFRVLETSHPPVYYLPKTDIATDLLVPTNNHSLCEWKGRARYYDLVSDTFMAPTVAWTYPDPHIGFEAIRDHMAFYAAPFASSPHNTCTVDGETVEPQPGGFYGGWITSDIVGPFKGAPGSTGW